MSQAIKGIQAKVKTGQEKRISTWIHLISELLLFKGHFLWAYMLEGLFQRGLLSREIGCI